MSQLIQFEGCTVAVLAPEDLEALEARLAETRAALRRYGGHEDDCAGTAGYLDPRCTCGFAAAMRAADSADACPHGMEAHHELCSAGYCRVCRAAHSAEASR